MAQGGYGLSYFSVRDSNNSKNSNRLNQRLHALSLHSKFDLYSKADDLPKVEDLKDYYQKLIDKYIPGELCW